MRFLLDPTTQVSKGWAKGMQTTLNHRGLFDHPNQNTQNISSTTTGNQLHFCVMAQLPDLFCMGKSGQGWAWNAWAVDFTPKGIVIGSPRNIGSKLLITYVGCQSKQIHQSVASFRQQPCHPMHGFTQPCEVLLCSCVFVASKSQTHSNSQAIHCDLLMC